MNDVESTVQGRRTYSKHGLTPLKRAVKGLGSRVIDMRTSLGKALAEWRADLVADLGGRDAVTPGDHPFNSPVRITHRSAAREARPLKHAVR